MNSRTNKLTQAASIGECIASVISRLTGNLRQNIRFSSLLVMALMLATTGVAQIKKSKYRVILEEQANENINLLKNGVLLVRLNSRENVLRVLRKQGNTKVADELEQKQVAFNKNVIKAFRTNFTFCPVYFFYSEHSDSIYQNRVQHLPFLSDSLLVDPNLHYPKNKKYLTAEITTIEADTASYYSHTSYEPDKNWSVKKEKNYYSGPSLGFDALIIKSDLFIQLRDPFPYYVRTRDPMPKMDKLNKVLSKLNLQLNTFYEEHKTQ